MTLSPEKSFAIAREALQNVCENVVRASPIAFELWFTHIAGENPALSSALKRALEESHPLEDCVTREIHERFFADVRVASEVLTASGDITEKVSEIIDHVSESESEFSKFGSTVRDAQARLEENNEPAAVGEILETVSSAASSMATKSEALERRLADASEELKTLRTDINRARQEALTDGLTGIANRKKFDLFMEEVFAERLEEQMEACLILGDVDHFKNFNDRWGHQIGDQVLKLVAQALKANTKGRDLVARYGGEEFAVVLPYTSLSNAKALAEKLRHEVASHRITRKATQELIGRVTISFGVAAIMDGDEIADVVERADQCLYEAKRRGRDCVVSEDEAPFQLCETV
ncbi:MAG: GGDEF domain-containing protein [Pseudomonadota bacterium]